jgi:Raf kinase inhibitor-like YbhB/YbcL family protein
MKPRLLTVLPLLMLGAAQVHALTVTSPDLQDGGSVNKEQVYTRCGGGNVSPALSWSGVPAGTKSFAITAIDLSVKPNGWSHWIVVGLPANTTSLGKGATLPGGAKAVMTDFGDEAYAGPCPPSGSGVHRYQFTVWALKTATVEFAHNATAMDDMAALEKAALAKASVTAGYQR